MYLEREQAGNDQACEYASDMPITPVFVFICICQIVLSVFAC